MLWKDGTNYMGEWKRNRPSGFGFEAYPNGSYYQVLCAYMQRGGGGRERVFPALTMVGVCHVAAVIQ